LFSKQTLSKKLLFMFASNKSDWLIAPQFTIIHHKTVLNTIIHLSQGEIVSSNSLKMADR